MITPAFAQTMAAYNAELNRRVYGAAAGLTDAQRRHDGGAFWRSIHATLSHLLWADQMWMSRLDGWDKPAMPLAQSGNFLDGPFEAMTKARIALDGRLAEWAKNLRRDWLDGETSWFSGATGRTLTRSNALLVMHLFNHQTHHRGQAHALLTRDGAETGATDLPFVLA